MPSQKKISDVDPADRGGPGGIRSDSHLHALPGPRIWATPGALSRDAQGQAMMGSRDPGVDVLAPWGEERCHSLRDETGHGHGYDCHARGSVGGIRRS